MSSPQPGQKYGPYQVISQIGQGGMATVYKAYHAAMDRYVALKVLPHQFAQTEEFMGRFRQEVRLIARLEHPHILPVYDYGESEGIPYLVMRLLESGTLRERIRAGVLELDEIDRIFKQLADGLAYAHEQGVIHRDIKPSNVMLDPRGDVFLTDFGIAKLVEATAQFTATGAVTGTPAYMSPEQAQGEKVDPRTDIYSLGIVLYEMLTGKVPFEAETPLAVLLKKVQEPPPPPTVINPEVPEPLEAVLLKALATDPGDRYATVGEFLAAWTGALAKSRQNMVVRRVAQDREGGASIERSPVPEIRATRIPVSHAQPVGRRKVPAWVWNLGGAAIIIIVILAVVSGVGGFLNTNSRQTIAEFTQIPEIPAAATEKPTLGQWTATVAEVVPATETPQVATATYTPIPPTFTLPPPTDTPRQALEPIQVTSGTGNCYEPSFSPDGEKIVFISDRDGNREIYIINVDGTGETRLTFTNNVQEDLPSLSPDGTLILYGGHDGRDEEIYWMATDGSQVRNLSNSPGTNEGRPKFSPSGLLVTFDSDRTGNWEIFTANLVEMTQVTNRPDFRNRLPSFSPLGDRLIFRSEIISGGTEGSSIYSVRLDGSDLVKLSGEFTAWYPAVSPSGQWVAFVSDRDGNPELYAMRMDGSEVTRLTENAAHDTDPAFSPDGKWIVYASKGESGIFDLWLLPVDLRD